MRYLFEVFGKRFTGAAVVVPVGMVKLHKPRTAFHQSTRQQAVVGKTRLSGFRAIKIQSGLGFA